MAVLEGDNATVRCSVDASAYYSVRWFKDSFNRGNAVFFEDQINKMIFPDYDINRTVPVQYDLIINFVRTLHAGRYICWSDESWSSAELVVIGKANLLLL